MNLARFLSEDRVDLDLDAAFDGEEPVTNDRLVEHMAALLETSPDVVNPSKLRNDLVNRERRAPSLLGDGIALPHVRTLQARRLVIAVGVSRKGLALDTPDGDPVRLVIALVGPPYDDRVYLQVYKRLSDRLTVDGWTNRIVGAGHPGEVVRSLSM